MAIIGKILVLHGPNLNLLGRREPEVYGKLTLPDVNAMLTAKAAELDLEIEFVQTNHEGVLIDWLHEAYVAGAKAVLLNAGGYTHTSIAIHDAIKAIKVPGIEVHLSLGTPSSLPLSRAAECVRDLLRHVVASTLLARR